MEYRLCIIIDGEKKKSAFAFYNQQDHCVYRRVADITCDDVESEYVCVCVRALEYFRKNMRNRYYTEHFSELLDEDKGRVLCSISELVDAWRSYREEKKPIAEKYLPLSEQFDLSSVLFEYCDRSELHERTKQLI